MQNQQSKNEDFFSFIDFVKVDNKQFYDILVQGMKEMMIQKPKNQLEFLGQYLLKNENG
ncbi:hypothetical protein pb186bvf_012773 [Paramecium bursaria]